MHDRKRRRKRGVILTDKGWQQFLRQKREWENRNKSGTKYTLEELCELTDLVYSTVFRIVERRKGVDKRTLVKFLMAFDLELQPSSYTSPTSLKSSSRQQIVRKVDWDRLIEIPSFFGRDTELTILKKWLLEERCRLISICGIGGIGKTALCAKLVKQIEQQFECVVWRSLENPLPLEHFLIDLNHVLSASTSVARTSNNNAALDKSELLKQLIDRLRSHRCLLVLDGLENIMQGGVPCGKFLQQYQDYSRLVEYFADVSHQSCLLLVTREQPKEISFRLGEKLFVKSLKLSELSDKASLQLVSNFGLKVTKKENNKLAHILLFHPLNIIRVCQKITSVHRDGLSSLANKNYVLDDTVANIIEEHLKRLSNVESRLIYYLLANNDAKSFSALKQDSFSSLSSATLIQSLESLMRRSLVIKKESKFAAHNIIFQYMFYINKI